ncbi:MAG: Endonuclease NucS [Candidatus Scalindua rubra]|uniref:Endonuclease NucS n=1 Tax=Candidatus Scalindua rubra TaxID=1872076 RepID=A0A1E3X767_9BACT|nr:MAG: Endonuclease NucS [Candidatus Scalindua rubra]
MPTFSISEEAIDQVIQKIDSFVWTDKDREVRETLRQQFRQTYNKDRIDNLNKEDYFAGLGRKHGCLAYDLEWGTRKLGSIKGGSKYKYGYEADFPKIKSLFQKIISIDSNNAYQADGSFAKDLEKIATLSKDINGFKTGRTVIPKLLSIYYPDIFLPIFNDQDHFLSKLLNSGLETENTGLDLYLENNYKLLRVRQKLEEVTNRTFENYEFAILLYHTFPKEQEMPDSEQTPTEKPEEQKFEALEVQHYQSLIHRNFHRLFPKLKYFDEEEQTPKNGQYDTQTIGIMDMLCIDDRGDFIIIEIKRQAADKTIGQILRYMGWTKEELCKDRQKVKGLLLPSVKTLNLSLH